MTTTLAPSPPLAPSAWIEVLDPGEPAVAREAIAGALLRVREGHATLVGLDRNALCHRVPWPHPAGDGSVIVKSVRRGAQRTNADTTFAGEAAMLARLPAAGVDFAPRLIARARCGGEHYLLMTEMPGVHPDPLAHPLTAGQLAAIVGALHRMDCAGLMHYDLKPENILVTSDAAVFLDFEFSRFESWQDSFGAAKASYFDDFNVAPNPHFRARTNLANFEFRTLSRHCAVVASRRDDAASESVLRGYLAARAGCHASRARWLVADVLPAAEDLARAGELPAAAVRSRVRSAIALEQLFCDLLREGDADVVAAERLLMGLRRAAFERDGIGWRGLRRRLQVHLGRLTERDPDRGIAYAGAVEATADAVGRSVHPDTGARVDLD